MIKRLFDLALAGFWAIVTSPVMLVVATLIKLDSPGPIFYAPLAVGKNGKPFRMFRFRTMDVDKSPDLTPSERLTRVGRFIRNYSLDHLPTLFNVLKDDMRVVGPRPMEPEAVDLDDPTWQKILAVKPGMISLAILKLGKRYNASPLAIKKRLEMEYVEQQSFRFDLQMLLEGLGAHVASTGNVKARENLTLKQKAD
ncbi:MAG: sugar transferase [Anaerolineae bacterium]|nr:MAG: sugar transferase [Anaerolineae bacterium]